MAAHNPMDLDQQVVPAKDSAFFVVALMFLVVKAAAEEDMAGVVVGGRVPVMVVMAQFVLYGPVIHVHSHQPIQVIFNLGETYEFIY